jgi:hypothetical protein
MLRAGLPTAELRDVAKHPTAATHPCVHLLHVVITITDTSVPDTLVTWTASTFRLRLASAPWIAVSRPAFLQGKVFQSASSTPLAGAMPAD